MKGIISNSTIFWLTAMSIITVGCVQDLTFQLPSTEPQIVVNGHFRPDSLWQVRLTLSRTAGSGLPIVTISEAAVDLFHGDKFLETLVFNPSIFGGDGGYMGATHRPLADELYSIKISFLDGRTLESSDRIPVYSAPAPRITRMNENADFDRPQFLIQTSVASSERRYHAILLQRIIDWTYDGLDTTYRYGPWKDLASFDSDQGEGQGLLDLKTGVEIIQFSLVPVPGLLINIGETEASTEFNVVLRGPTLKLQQTTSSGKFAQFQAEVRKVSEAYYEYYRSVHVQVNANEDIFFDAPDIKSNIVNGLGNFSGYNAKRSQIITIGR